MRLLSSVFCSAVFICQRNNGIIELHCESIDDFQAALNTRLASYYLYLHLNHSTDAGLKGESLSYPSFAVSVMKALYSSYLSA